MSAMFWIWLGVIVLSVIIEVVTLELVSIWFAFGAIVPFILSAVSGVSLVIQIILFVGISALLVILLRKYAQKLLFKGMDEKTNIDSFTGKVFRLTEGITIDKNGSLKANDIVWTAKSENGEEIKQGEFVEIVKVEGNKLIVKKAQNIQSEQKNIIDKEKEEDEFIIEKKAESENSNKEGK